MPTLPLFVPATHPDGWRQVRAPGGYECWLFEAHDQQLRLTIGLWLGHPENAAYVNRYRRYLARPTRTPPPLPAEYPSLAVEVAEGERVVFRVLQHEAAADFQAAGGAADVLLGDCRLAAYGGGEYLLQANEIDSGFYAGLTFHGVETSKSTDDGPHHAVMILEDAAVKGELCLPGRDIDFAGRGSHTHLFGTRFPSKDSALR